MEILFTNKLTFTQWVKNHLQCRSIRTQIQSLGQKRPPGEGIGKPLQYSPPEKSHGQRILLGCSQRVAQESDSGW